MDTTMVLSILSLTTRPTLVLRLFWRVVTCTVLTPALCRPLRRGGSGPVPIQSTCRRVRRGRTAPRSVVLHRQDPGNRPACLRDRAVVLQLPRRERKARLPELLLGIAQGLLELRVREGAGLINVHR